MGDLLRHARRPPYRGDDAGIRAAAADVPLELAVEFIAEYVEERAFGIALDAMPGAVDDQFHAFIVGQLGKLRGVVNAGGRGWAPGQADYKSAASYKPALQGPN